jgi:hypothetical protein
MQRIEVENELKTLDSFMNREVIPANIDNPQKMLRLSRLTVRFKNAITQSEIPLLVDAIARKSLKNKDMFHQHIVSGSRYIYPLIQFKKIKGQAAIVCMGEGTESVGGFFSSAGEHITVAGKEMATDIERIKAETIIVQAWNNNFTYTIRKYLPLSSDNYIEYQKITDDSARNMFICSMLRANILLFTESLGIQLDREIVCMITEFEEKAKVKYKNHTFVSFDLKFKTNISLPDFIGLGIGVSHGFGMVARVKSQKNN